MIDNAAVGELTPDELQLLADYRLNKDSNKITIRLLARGLRISGENVLSVSDAEALQVLRSIPA